MIRPLPTNLQILLDSDILRYEIGHACETGWRAMHPEDPEALPPFNYVQDLLHQRISNIKTACQTDKEPTLYITEGRTFRFDIAKRKEYKGNRKSDKPFHFDNLTAYLKYLGAKVITGIEADDALSIDHSNSNGTTILVSRDKDLLQCEGWAYVWELGRQPSLGPLWIDKVGDIDLSAKKDKVKGVGTSFFWTQVLTGDPADNTPGLPNYGPVAAISLLKPITACYRAGGADEATTLANLEKAVVEAYKGHYGPVWKEELEEQYNLHKLLTKINEDGSPVLWMVEA